MTSCWCWLPIFQSNSLVVLQCRNARGGCKVNQHLAWRATGTFLEEINWPLARDSHHICCDYLPCPLIWTPSSMAFPLWKNRMGPESCPLNGAYTVAPSAQMTSTPPCFPLPLCLETWTRTWRITVRAGRSVNTVWSFSIKSFASAVKLERNSGLIHLFLLPNVGIRPSLKGDEISSFKYIFNVPKLTGYCRLLQESTPVLSRNTSVPVWNRTLCSAFSRLGIWKLGDEAAQFLQHPRRGDDRATQGRQEPSYL